MSSGVHGASPRVCFGESNRIDAHAVQVRRSGRDVDETAQRGQLGPWIGDDVLEVEAVEAPGSGSGLDVATRGREREVQLDLRVEWVSAAPPHRGDVVERIAHDLHDRDRHAHGRREPIEEVGLLGQADGRQAAPLVTDDREVLVATLPLPGHGVGVAPGLATGRGVGPGVLQHQRHQLRAVVAGGDVAQDVELVGYDDVGVGVEQRANEAVTAAGMTDEHDERAHSGKVLALAVALHRRPDVQRRVRAEQRELAHAGDDLGHARTAVGLLRPQDASPELARSSKRYRARDGCWAERAAMRASSSGVHVTDSRLRFGDEYRIDAQSAR